MIRIEFPVEELLKWTKEAKTTVEEFVVEFLQDMNEEVVMGTPFITGNLRGHWFGAVGSEPDATGGSPDSGGGAIARMNAAVAALKIGDTYYAANGASYAGFVEFGTRNMAPRGFVRSAVDRAPEIMAAAAARVAKE